MTSSESQTATDLGAYRTALGAACGIGAPPDLQASLDYLQQAAQLGLPAARAELAALVGNWRLVCAISAGKTSSAGTWERLRAAGDVGAWLNVPQGRVFSSEPRIAVVRRFVSAQLCDWLVQLGRPHLRRAEIFNREQAGLREDDSRTNSAAELGLQRADMVLAFVRARIATLVELPISALDADACQILHYAVGQEFAPHYDFLDVSFPGLASDVASRGQRAVTFLIYLNDDYEGGETAFPVLGRGFKGSKGDALIFWNVDENGAPDRRTLHTGTAPTRGEKWLFSQWIRVRFA
jgi:prolyl 4-hydroxylase